MVNFRGETNPVIECVVGKEKLKLLVDTGSRVSLVKSRSLSRTSDGWQQEVCPEDSKISLVGITGDPIHTFGCFTIPVEINRTTFKAKFFVCGDELSLKADGIIGQDLLMEQDADLLLSEGCLRIGSERVPITNWANKQRPATEQNPDKANLGVLEAGEVNLVSLIEETVLPPLSECVLAGKTRVPVPSGEIKVVEVGGLGTNGLAAVPTLVVTRDEEPLPVRVTNLTLKEIRLPKNKVVGALVDVEEFQLVASVDKVGESKVTDEDLLHMFDLSHIEGRERGMVTAMIVENKSIFSTDKTDLGRCEAIKHRIYTGDATPVYRRAYRIPFARREEMEKQVDSLLEADIIQHSTSPWGAPALLVEKPDGSYRFVVDYRDLNKVTRIDPYPLPNVQETLAQLGNAKYFTVVDMASGYWQIEMEPRDREKTAFNTPSGHYEWNRMPMGLVNSAAIWQRTADVILAGLLGKLCHVYLDDIIIYSGTFEDHLRDLGEVFSRVRAAGLKLKPSKCQFLKSEVKYLGHIVSAAGVRPDPAKVECVKEFPAPKNKTEVRQFLGLLSYYRRHIPSFAEVAKPLTRLTSKSPFAWDLGAEAAFGQLKTRLVEAPILRFPDFSKPFTLTTDASKCAIGAVLSQVHDGNEHPVAYASRQLNTAEQKYGATEQECLAVVWAVRHFRCYLYGRKFKIVTDCQPLKWLMNVRDPSSRLARWNLLLQEYNFDIVHRPGKRNQNADALSRVVVAGVNSFVPSPDEAQFREEQGKDQTLQITIGNCKSAPDSAHAGYYLDDAGLLRHRRKSVAGVGKIVVPRSMVEELMQVHHDSPCAGHLGVRKTLLRLKRRYFWLGMKAAVAKYCRECESCILRKIPKGRKQAPPQIFPDVYEPFQRTAMDIVGPLPCATSGNRYILVFVDHLTRFAEAFALPDQKAETVAKVFAESIVLRHGVPRQLLTDQGANFTGKLMRELCDVLRVKRLRTTAYHPECNGAVERLNQTLVKIMSHYVNEDQRDWDRWVPFATFAYNTAVHEGTGESPYYLLYGRDPVIPGVVFEEPMGHYGTLDDYRAELTQRLQRAHKVASSTLRSAAESRKNRLIPFREDPKFNVGERVYIRVSAVTRGLTKKLAPKWVGPYRIIERLSSVTVRVRDIKTREKKVIHVNRLRRAAPFERTEPERSHPRESSTRPPASSHFETSKENLFNLPPELLLEAMLQGQPQQARPQAQSVGHRYALRSRGPVPDPP